MSVSVSEGHRFLLADVLRKLNMSQRKLSRLMDVDQNWVGRIHNGRQQPTWETVQRIARVLGVSVGVFADNDPARLRFFTEGHQEIVDPMAANSSRAGGPTPGTVKRPRKPRPRKQAG
jgi:transcriptional regulator with XRE-family HTH domain